MVAPMHMPIKQTVAFLLANKPAAAAKILLAMTPDRIAVLAEVVEPSALCRILIGSDPGQRADVLSLIPPDRRAKVLQHLTPGQAFELLKLVPPDIAWEVLGVLQPRTAAELYAEIPAQARRPLQDAMPSDQPEEFFAALYERRAVDSVARSMPQVSRMQEGTGDLLVDVFGKRVQVSVRYLPEKVPFAGGDVQRVAGAALWTRIIALVIMTNTWIGDSALALARAFTTSGRPVEVLRWVDDRGDGLFKRLLVRLAS